METRIGAGRLTGGSSQLLLMLESTFARVAAKALIASFCEDCTVASVRVTIAEQRGVIVNLLHNKGFRWVDLTAFPCHFHVVSLQGKHIYTCPKQGVFIIVQIAKVHCVIFILNSGSNT